MNILQSYWSLPLHPPNADGKEAAGPLGGWPHPRYHYFSWTLSCLLFRRYYEEVELVTDEAGKARLIDQLELPYTRVTTCLDDINHFPAPLWAMGKIHAYRRQRQPFLHADGDVFIWRPFPADLEQAPLFAQSPETGFAHYGPVLEAMRRSLPFIPQILRSEPGQPVRSINAGIIGGTDIDFFQEYTAQALDFVERNRDYLRQVDMNLFNQVYEQYLFARLASHRKKEIRFYLPQTDDQYTQTLNFHLLPSIQSYIHVVGHAKRNLLACRQVEYRLRYEFPEYYRRALDFLGETDERRSIVSGPPEKNGEKDDVAHFFPRTLFLLEQSAGESSTPATIAELESLVDRRTAKDKPLTRALSATFRLERQKRDLYHKTNRTPPSDPFDNVRQIFRFLDGKTTDQVLEACFALPPEAELLEVDWYLPPDQSAGCLSSAPPRSEEWLSSLEQAEGQVLLFWNTHTRRVDEILLEGWPALLLEFTSPARGRDVFEALLTHLGEEAGDVQGWKGKLVDFITQCLLYDGALRLVREDFDDRAVNCLKEGCISANKLRE